MTQSILNNTLNNLEKITFEKDCYDKKFVDNSSNFEQIFNKTQNGLASTKTKVSKISDAKNDADTEGLAAKDSISSEEETLDSSKLDLESSENGTTKNTENLVEKIEEFVDNGFLYNVNEDVEDTTENIGSLEVIEDLESLGEQADTDNSTNQNGEDSLNIDDSNLLENIANTIHAIIPNVEKSNGEDAIDANISNESSEDDLNVSINGETLDVAFKNLGINEDSEESISNQITNVSKKDASIEDADAEALEEIIDEDTLKGLKIESIEVETGDSSNNSSDLMQNQTPEEQGIKAMMNIDGDFADIKVDTAKNMMNSQISKPSSPTELGPSKIIEQISKQLEGLNSSSKVNIVLNPESLGKVSVQLINTKEGLSAQFTVATQDARNLIMKGLDGLKDTLMAHGVSVDNVTVKMNETQESGYQADWTEQEGSRGGNKQQDSNREPKEQQNFEEMMSSIDNDDNGKI